MWNRPLDVNSPSITYELWLNGYKIYIQSEDSMNETFHYSLNSCLQPFTNYVITVRACSFECSSSINNLNIKTKMAKPSRMLQPMIEKVRGKDIKVSWIKPINITNNYTFYQISVGSENKYEIYFINGRQTSCIIEFDSCHEKLDVSMRAINSYNITLISHLMKSENCLSLKHNSKQKQNEVLELIGDWSPLTTVYCNTTAFAMLFIPCFSILIAVIVMLIIIKIYKYYQNMKDIEITLPKGLDPDLWISTSNNDIRGIENKHIEMEKDQLESLNVIENNDDKDDYSVKPDILEDNVISHDETLHPFIRNPFSNEFSYTMPKSYSQNIDLKTSYLTDEKGYMKMTLTRKTPKLSPIHKGYLDMNGKSHVCETSTTDYQEIETFIRKSVECNDGYIGKNNSTLSELLRKSKSSDFKDNNKSIDKSLMGNNGSYVRI